MLPKAVMAGHVLRIGHPQNSNRFSIGKASIGLTSFIFLIDVSFIYSSMRHDAWMYPCTDSQIPLVAFKYPRDQPSAYRSGGYNDGKGNLRPLIFESNSNL